MQIDKSIYAQGGGLHEKNYTLDVSDSSNYVGVSMSPGSILPVRKIILETDVTKERENNNLC